MLKVLLLRRWYGRNAGSREFYTETKLLEPSTGHVLYRSL